MAKYFKATEDEYWQSPENYRTITSKSPVATSFFVIGADDSDVAPVAAVLALKPGDIIGHHAHSCDRFEVVVRGSLAVEGGETLVPGDIMVSRSGEFYGPHVAGPEGCVTVEIFSDAIGAKTVLFKLADGSVREVAAEAAGDDGVLDELLVKNDEWVPERLAAIMDMASGATEWTALVDSLYARQIGSSE